MVVEEIHELDSHKIGILVKKKEEKLQPWHEAETVF